MSTTTLEGANLLFSWLRKTSEALSTIITDRGNESMPSQIVFKIKQYLQTTKLIVDDKPVVAYNEKFITLLKLLTINTELDNINELANIPQYNDLIGKIPWISKFLLVHIIVELDLVPQCCSLVVTLPPAIGEEIFDTFNANVPRCESLKPFIDSFNITKTIIDMFIQLNADDNQQNTDIIYRLGEIASNIMRNMSLIDEGWGQHATTIQLHTRMGYIVFFLIRLFRSCPLQNYSTSSLNTVVETLRDLCTGILIACRVEVPWTWARVYFEGRQQMLNVIAAELYMFLLHLPKGPPDPTFIEMLRPMAPIFKAITKIVLKTAILKVTNNADETQQDRTITEAVLNTNIERVIANAEHPNENQLTWFKDVLNPNLYKDEEAMNYLEKWVHLCTKDDVMRLLVLSFHYKQPQVKALILKCAKLLTVQDWEIVSKKYFNECDISKLNTSYIKKNLRTLLNRPISGPEVNDEFIKFLYLLLLQNPKFVLATLFAKCLKRDSYVTYIKRAFSSIKASLEQIPNLTIQMFVKVFKCFPPSRINLHRHRDLLYVLIVLGYLDTQTILNEIFKPRLEVCLRANNCNRLLHTLYVLKNIPMQYMLHADILQIIPVLNTILRRARCNSENFRIMKQQIVEDVLTIFSRFSYLPFVRQYHMQYKGFFDNLPVPNPMNRYYITRLYQNLDGYFLEYIWPGSSRSCVHQDLHMLINILPALVGSEWMLLLREMDAKYNNYPLLLSIFECLFINLSKEVIARPGKIAEDCLRYYVTQYAFSVWHVLKSKYNAFEMELALIESVCKILKNLPQNIRRIEGLHLINVLSSPVLCWLNSHNRFLFYYIMDINDEAVSRALATKMCIHIPYHIALVLTVYLILFILIINFSST